MRTLRQIIAVLALLAWLGASAHLAIEHGGESFGPALGEAAHAGHGHDADPAPDEGDHHHHDLGVVTVVQFAKSAEQQLLAPRWVPIYDRWVAEIAALLRGAEVLREHSGAGDSPPDTRRSGWLFVVQTALPVRGPSLEA